MLITDSLVRLLMCFANTEKFHDLVYGFLILTALTALTALTVKENRKLKNITTEVEDVTCSL